MGPTLWMKKGALMTITPLGTDTLGRKVWDVKISAGSTPEGKRRRLFKRVHGSLRSARDVERELYAQAAAET